MDSACDSDDMQVTIRKEKHEGPSAFVISLQKGVQERKTGTLH